MPTYIYQCAHCEDVLETVRSIADRDKSPEQLCDGCEKPEWRRVFNAPMVMRAGLPDGNGRFSNLREASKLKRLKSEANGRGDIQEAKRLDKEILKTRT